MKAFRKLVYEYYRTSGRHDLPWRLTTDPYAILVSEIMLQQTQVGRIIPKYTVFLARYPSVKVLAESSTKELLTLWSGIGYNRRALWLKETARELLENFNSTVPANPEVLMKLKGIGYATACAIAAYSYNTPVVFIETNIRTVFIHHFFSGKENVHDRELMPLVEDALDTMNPRTWYYALMDYGVYLKKNYPNASRRSRHYTKQSPFKGSDRQIRGWLLKRLSSGGISVEECIAECTESLAVCDSTGRRIGKIMAELEKEGFIRLENGIIDING